MIMTGWTGPSKKDVMHASVKMNVDMLQPCGHLLGKGCLLAPLYMMFSCVSVTFPYGVLGKV